MVGIAGVMRYRTMKPKLSIRKDPKEELTVISCKKCGRAWQVTESDAKEFMEHKELLVRFSNPFGNIYHQYHHLIQP